MDELLQKLDQGVVFTLNPDHLYHLQRNPEFLEAYLRADFVTCDSKYLLWALRLMRRRVRANVSGSDIVPAFYRQHRSNPAIRIFLLGAAPGVAQRARERINLQAGRDIVVGAHGPSMNFAEDPDEIAATIRMIDSAGTTVLIVGLGAPKQELWIDRYRGALPNVKIFMGVGATIDYEADAVVRAPPWMRRCGLEWLYRVVTEPRRYARRYFRASEFVWLVLLDGLGLYRAPSRVER